MSCKPLLTAIAKTMPSHKSKAKPTKKQLTAAKKGIYKAANQLPDPLGSHTASIVQTIKKKESVFGKPSTKLREASFKYFYYLRDLPPSQARLTISKFLMSSSSSSSSSSSNSSHSSMTSKENEVPVKSMAGLTISAPAAVVSTPAPPVVVENKTPIIKSYLNTPGVTMSSSNPPSVLTMSTAAVEKTTPFFASPKKKMPPPVGQPEMMMDPSVFPHLENIAKMICSGTRNLPELVVVDVEHPEKCGAFDVVWVDNIKHEGHLRQAFHVRKTCDVFDADDWDATIPDSLPAPYEQFLGHSILVEGPSRPYWFRSNSHYHRTPFCEATKDAHAAAQLEIEKDRANGRSKKFWLLVFPSSIPLDNTIFSGDATTVAKHHVPMKEKTSGGKSIMAMAVYWIIGIHGGRKYAEKATPKKKSIDELYDFSDSDSN